MNDLTSKFQTTKIFQSLFLIGMMLAITAFAATAQQPDSSAKERFISIKENMQAAVDSMDQKKLIRAKYAMEDFTDNEDKQIQKLAHYFIGYVDYRLSTQFEGVSDDQKEQYLDEAQEQLEKTVEMDPSFAEGHAMLGSVYGMKAAGFFSGMKYGPKSSSAIEKALAAGPDNPRVHMINAIGLLNKPSMFGGSTEGAIKELKNAARLFESFKPANEMMPNWGHAENYAWLGQAYEQNDQLKKAKAAYIEALNIDPNYGWVKYRLMPQLEDKLN